MAIAAITNLQMRTEVTPPSTPEAQSKVTASQTTEQPRDVCSSERCIHKLRSNHKRSQKAFLLSASESDSTKSSESCSDDENSTSDSEVDEPTRPGKKNSTKSASKRIKSKKKGTRSKSSKKEKVSPKKSDETAGSDQSQDKKGEKNDSSLDEAESLETHLTTQGFDMSNKQNKAIMRLLLQTLTESHQEPDSDSSAAESSDKEEEKSSRKSSKRPKRASKADFKRVDEIWDNETYAYKLKETSNEKKTDEFERFIFTVRRKFDTDGHYEETVVDLKSQPLKECLQSILANVEGISLVEDTPSLMPNMLFPFLEDMRKHLTTLRQERKEASKKKAKKLAGTKLKHLTKLVEYLDEDYEETKKSLYPLLKSGRITFEYLWALYKPNTVAYSSTYGDEETPRAFRIESIYKQKSLARGVYYEIEGKYFDFDGKCFGTASYCVQVCAFQGPRKITSLGCYPLQYHPESKNIRPRLIERGKQFLCLAGQNYRFYKGMAYVKKSERILKANVDGRIMIDPETFRRINPNYPMQDVEARLLEPDDEEACVCESQSKNPLRMYRLLKTKAGDAKVIEIDRTKQNDLDEQIDLPEEESHFRNVFTEDELLLASPVLFGFCFSEKTWLEFNVATISDVQWNDGAFDSLVLPAQHKSIVKALVSAHGKHSARGFDDIIAGKGKGLVAVLHGRPGLGKTLTCEAVSDLLKRPLYTVSAGDLGTSASVLEAELQSILDIAHTWNAVLLLDEADVFLEERSVHDVHRNALVSIFLRLLEYFQGILFLTTNRVETFDAAFVSRIHLSLRYGELSLEAKKSVWKTFIDKVKHMDGSDAQVFSEKDLNSLARHDMNGRQIKNLVKTAQALASHEGASMGMEHIRHVIDVARSFEMDLKGGSGYSDAMRSYS